MTETFVEVLIGYDARLAEYQGSERDAGSNASLYIPGYGRSNGFGYGHRHGAQYSVDSNVWASVVGDNRPETVGKESGTWARLDDLRDYVQTQKIARWVPCCIIAVCAYREADEMDDWNMTHLQIETEIVPPGRNRKWPLLGFDVSNRYLSGSVTESLPRDPEESLLWKMQLNSHMLFGDIRDAFGLRRYWVEKFDETKSEVYGLYLVETVEKDAPT